MITSKMDKRTRATAVDMRRSLAVCDASRLVGVFKVTTIKMSLVFVRKVAAEMVKCVPDLKVLQTFA